MGNGGSRNQEKNEALEKVADVEDLGVNLQEEKKKVVDLEVLVVKIQESEKKKVADLEVLVKLQESEKKKVADLEVLVAKLQEDKKKVADLKVLGVKLQDEKKKVADLEVLVAKLQEDKKKVADLEILVAKLQEDKKKVANLEVLVAKLQEEKRILQNDLANMAQAQQGKISERSGAYVLNSATPSDVSQAFRGISVPVRSFNSSLSKCIRAGSAEMDHLRSGNYKDVNFLEPGQASALILKAEVMRILFENFENESFSAGGHSVYPDPAKRKTEFFALFQNFEKGAYDNQFVHYHDKTKTRVWQTFRVKQSAVTQSMDQAFRKAARNVWALHLLSFSFEPPVSLFRVPRGADFDKNYMKPEAYSGADGIFLENVAFTLIPGLRSSKFPTLKAEIYPVFQAETIGLS